MVISFNGGRGSASLWMHVVCTGPKVLNIDDDGYPQQAYGVHDNESSLLDVADIVYVNPMNTGYSRTIPSSGYEVKKVSFFAINAKYTIWQMDPSGILQDRIGFKGYRSGHMMYLRK